MNVNLELKKVLLVKDRTAKYPGSEICLGSKIRPIGKCPDAKCPVAKRPVTNNNYCRQQIGKS